jgi:hypothetical protein
MGKARYLADLLGATGDVKSTRFDSMPAIDWNASSGSSRVLNKPTMFSGSYNNLTDKPTILVVETVATLPTSPVAGTLYLVTA